MLTSSDGYNVKIRTTFHEDYDSWELTDGTNGISIRVRTSFTNDFDNWDAIYEGSNVIDLKTTYREDWDRWTINGEIDVPNAHKAAILFIGVFTGALKQQGIVD